MKILALCALGLALSACVGSTSEPLVAKMTSEIAASPVCPNSPHLRSIDGLQVRCGPQTELPYTLN